MQRFEIFKPGKHVSAAGAELSFSDADLAAIVANYSPAVHEAPIVVGHPRDNGPAYGWVASIAFSEGALAADPAQVDADFAEMVKNGRFKKRSASFYAPGAKNHPLAGKDGHDAYYLRHVGFLGAAAPAVKGLKAVEFAADDESVSFEEDWASKGTLSRLFSNLRDWMLVTHGQEKADAVLPKWEVEGLKDAARPPVDPAAIAATPAFHEETRMTPQEIEALKAKAAKADQLAADLEKVTAEFTEAKAKADAADTAAALAKTKADIEPHVAAGRVLPVEVDSLASFAATLDDGTATFDFAEGEKVEKVTARALFLGQLAKRPVAVDFSERAAAKGEKDEPVAEAQKKLLDQVSGKAEKAKK